MRGGGGQGSNIQIFDQLSYATFVLCSDKQKRGRYKKAPFTDQVVYGIQIYSSKRLHVCECKYIKKFEKSQITEWMMIPQRILFQEEQLQG